MRQDRAGIATAAWLTALLAVAGCTPVRSLPAAPPLPTVPSPPAPAPAVQRPEPSTPAEVRAEILRWFGAAGYGWFQAEALAQQAWTETGYRPCAVGPGGLRYLYQWGGARLARLREFAGDDGCPLLDTQLAFTDKELRDVPEYACFWRATTTPSALAALRRGFGHGHC